MQMSSDKRGIFFGGTLWLVLIWIGPVGLHWMGQGTGRDRPNEDCFWVIMCSIAAH